MRDANSITGQDKIGKAVVDICLLGRTRGFQHWTEIPLKLDDGTLAGTIEIKIKFTPAMRKKKVSSRPRSISSYEGTKSVSLNVFTRNKLPSTTVASPPSMTVSSTSST
mmetsp:Transcript_5902/g.8112  ORF Transcript_5902/g.8112 Transcript_5902/m.8112 type:complete len:109 (-) Transcript_5902:261-587(-)